MLVILCILWDQDEVESWDQVENITGKPPTFDVSGFLITRPIAGGTFIRGDQ